MVLRSRLLKGTTAMLVVAALAFAGCTKVGMTRAGTVLVVTGGVVSATGATVTAGCSGDDRPCAGSGEETNAGLAVGISFIAVGGFLALIGLLLWYKGAQK